MPIPNGRLPKIGDLINGDLQWEKEKNKHPPSTINPSLSNLSRPSKSSEGAQPWISTPIEYLDVPLEVRIKGDRISGL